jgi:hypothetical protein
MIVSIALTPRIDIGNGIGLKFECDCKPMLVAHISS